MEKLKNEECWVYLGGEFSFRRVEDRSTGVQKCRSADECAACMGTLFSPSVGASLVDAR